eukprot:2299171-Amphidinium_carterae.1
MAYHVAASKQNAAHCATIADEEATLPVLHRHQKKGIRPPRMEWTRPDGRWRHLKTASKQRNQR